MPFFNRARNIKTTVNSKVRDQGKSRRDRLTCRVRDIHDLITADMIPDANRLAHLAPHQRAEFTVTTRLLSCLVTESLLHALYFPLSGSSAAGFALILLRDPSKASASPNASTSQITDVFALIPLQGAPILADDDDGLTIRKIALLHSLDMDPLPLVISKYDQSDYQETSNSVALNTAILNTLNTHGWFTQTKNQLEPSSDPVFFWRSYARYANLTDSLTGEIAHEFANSVKWQGASISQRSTPILREK